MQQDRGPKAGENYVSTIQLMVRIFCVFGAAFVTFIAATNFAAGATVISIIAPTLIFYALLAFFWWFVGWLARRTLGRAPRLDPW